MTTRVSGNLIVVTSDPSRVTEVLVRAKRVRPHGTGVLTKGAERADFDPATGVVSFDAVPGAAVLTLMHLGAPGRGGSPAEVVDLVVPDTPTATLADCVRAAGLADDATRSELEALAADALAAVRESAAAARDASEALETASTAVDVVRGHADRAEEAEEGAVEARGGAEDSEEVSAGASAVAVTAAELFGQYAADAESAADTAGQAVESTSWDGDRLTVMGKQSPPLTGPTGDVGPEGPRGRPGDTGPRGLQGVPGPRGDLGPRGERGETGEAGRSVTVTGTVPTAADLPSSAGLGDGYITHDDGHLHVWGGSWVDVGTVRGPQGPVGSQGPEGPRGLAGATGPQGPRGTQGPQGERGPQGVKGDKGDKGDTGARGPQGVKGDVGPAGTVENVAWDDVQGKPSLSEEGHTHTSAEITNTVSFFGGEPTANRVVVTHGDGQLHSSRHPVSGNHLARKSYVDQEVGKKADVNHTHTAAQVGARPASWTPTASDVGARSDTWIPTASQVGAATLAQVDARVNARPAMFSGNGSPPSSIPGAVAGDFWVDTSDPDSLKLYKITGV